jgi:hypothetical protein
MEYELVDGGLKDDDGNYHHITEIFGGMSLTKFTRIEREVFTAHGKE